MNVTPNHTPIFSRTWYFNLEDAPEVDFKGATYSPTEVTVSERTIHGNTKTYLEFVSPKTKVISQYCEEPAAGGISVFDLPPEFLVQIMTACDGR